MLGTVIIQLMLLKAFTASTINSFTVRFFIRFLHGVDGRLAPRLLTHTYLEIPHGCFNVSSDNFHNGLAIYSS